MRIFRPIVLVGFFSLPISLPAKNDCTSLLAQVEQLSDRLARSYFEGRQSYDPRTPISDWLTRIRGQDNTAHRLSIVVAVTEMARLAPKKTKPEWETHRLAVLDASDRIQQDPATLSKTSFLNFVLHALIAAEPEDLESLPFFNNDHREEALRLAVVQSADQILMDSIAGIKLPVDPFQQHHPEIADFFSLFHVMDGNFTFRDLNALPEPIHYAGIVREGVDADSLSLSLLLFYIHDLEHARVNSKRSLYTFGLLNEEREPTSLESVLRSLVMRIRIEVERQEAIDQIVRIEDLSTFELPIFYLNHETAADLFRLDQRIEALRSDWLKKHILGRLNEKDFGKHSIDLIDESVRRHLEFYESVRRAGWYRLPT